MRVDWFVDTLRWYLVCQIATIACIPFALCLFRRVPGSGASFLRPLAMLFTLWPVWFLSGITRGLVPFNALALWIALLLFGGAGWYLARRTGILRWERLFHVVAAELVYLAAFLGFLVFRGFGPATTFQEKPGDLMLLASTMTSSSVPPTDAWLSGWTVNYYYVGHAIWGAIGKMAGVSPAVAFNLALISTFAMAFVTAAGLLAAIIGTYHHDTPARIGGLLGAVFVLVLGNPWSASRIMSSFSTEWNAFFFSGVGWQASRTIIDIDGSGTNPITEFPAFSFILGDLHPHLLALPFTLTAVGLAWMLVTLRRVNDSVSLLGRDAWRIATAGAVIGGLYAINSWDLPTHLVIGLLGLGVGTVGVAGRDRLIAAVVYVASALIAWLPFYLNFSAPTARSSFRLAESLAGIPVVGGVLASLAPYDGPKTSINEFFGNFGYMYTILLVLLVTEAWFRQHAIRERNGDATGSIPASFRYLALFTAALCILGAILVDAPLLVLCGGPVIITWLLLEMDPRVTLANLALVLFSYALILYLVPEFVMISDIFGTRMNTVFKVSYQVWLLMGVASAVSVVEIWFRLRRWLAARVVVPAAVALMVVLGLGYPVVASHQWVNWRSPNGAWQGLDGLAYLNDPGSGYSGEYAAIEWLREHATEDDVVLAAGGVDWESMTGRVASGSGVPTVIGWVGHENQWHLGDPAYTADAGRRSVDIQTLYSSPPSPELVDRYGITYIYVGPTERNGAGHPGEPGWEATGPFPLTDDPSWPGDQWELVFEQDGARIYHLNPTLPTGGT